MLKQGWINLFSNGIMNNQTKVLLIIVERCMIKEKMGKQ